MYEACLLCKYDVGTMCIAMHIATILHYVYKVVLPKGVGKAF